jgi:hypothetical protein
MALGDRQHVEACAILRRLADATERGAADPEAVSAARLWLMENHPDPATYVAAIRNMSEDPC